MASIYREAETYSIGHSIQDDRRGPYLKFQKFCSRAYFGSWLHTILTMASIHWLQCKFATFGLIFAQNGLESFSANLRRGA